MEIIKRFLSVVTYERLLLTIVAIGIWVLVFQNKSAFPHEPIRVTGAVTLEGESKVQIGNTVAVKVINEYPPIPVKVIMHGAEVDNHMPLPVQIRR